MFEWRFAMLWLSVVSAQEMVSPVTRCLWHNNSCVQFCPEWLIIRRSDCKQNYWQAQRTCDHPEQQLVGTVCGFARCDCPDPLVMDTDTGYCYDEDNCPTKHIV